MEGGSVNRMMSMGRYLANTVKYNEMKKRSGRWECQRNDVNRSVEHSGTGRKSEKSGRWSVNIILSWEGIWRIKWKEE